jgi:hypothetical protein
VDLNAEYRGDPPGVHFTFASGGREHVCVVSLHALAALAGSAISTTNEAVSVYQHYWRYIHAAALGLHAAGQARPFVRSEDVL